MRVDSNPKKRVGFYLLSSLFQASRALPFHRYSSANMSEKSMPDPANRSKIHWPNFHLTGFSGKSSVSLANISFRINMSVKNTSTLQTSTTSNKVSLPNYPTRVRPPSFSHNKENFVMHVILVWFAVSIGLVTPIFAWEGPQVEYSANTRMETAVGAMEGMVFHNFYHS